MNKILIICFAFLCIGCSKGDLRTTEKNAHHCTLDSSEKRASFILQCISNANPKSDEEPEDWITKCQNMAEETLCPEITMLITERCASNAGCYWVEISRTPKGV